MVVEMPVITFTVSFCEHSHTFAKIDEVVMGHPGQNGITSCLPYPCTIKNSARHNVCIDMGLLDHCVRRTLDLITNCHYTNPHPLTNPCIPLLSRVLGYFCRIKNRFYSNSLLNHLIFE